MNENGSASPSERYDPETLVLEAERIVRDAFRRLQDGDPAFQLETGIVNGGIRQELALAVSEAEAAGQETPPGNEKPKVGLLAAGVACVAGFALNCVLDSFLNKHKRSD